MSGREDKLEVLQRNLQIKIQKLLDLQREMEYYQQVLESTTLLLSEILKTKKVLQEILKNEDKTLEGIINLGVGIFSPGTIYCGKKVLVDIGASIGVWMDLPDAISRLEKHENKLKETANMTRNSLNNLYEMIMKLQMEIEQLRAYIDRESKKK